MSSEFQSDLEKNLKRVKSKNMKKGKKNKNETINPIRDPLTHYVRFQKRFFR